MYQEWVWRVVITLLVLSVVEGLVVNHDITLKPKDKVIEYRINKEPFGFLVDANITVTLDCMEDLKFDAGEPTLELFVCPKSIYQIVSPTYRSHCEQISSVPVEPGKKLIWTYKIRTNKFSRLYLKDSAIAEKSMHCKIQAVFLNPGGEHLSSDQLAIPQICSAAGGVWCVALFLWSFNYLYYVKFSNKLHKMVTLLMILKVLVVVLSLLSWKDISIRGYVQVYMHVLNSLALCGYQVGMLVLIMLASEGWCIIYEKPRLWKYYIILAVSYSTMYLSYTYIHQYFQGFIIVFVGVMIYMAFRCCTISLCTLRGNLSASKEYIENYNLFFVNPEITFEVRLKKKLVLMTMLQILIIGLPCILMLLQSVSSFLLGTRQWVKWLCFEVLNDIVMLYCCYMFKLSDFSTYNNVVISTLHLQTVVILTPNRNILYINSTEDTLNSPSDSNSKTTPT